ncbi:hypothetical protein ETB97_002084 [Aspergillus alliaceus]|uniref:Uncharacterized protein n=1 Tax=Petromyces alliaceus TaxID=209559 RepID=A0A8H6E6A1_PETAA|nr:hypothetical protein ETB97_002084 [Aspergillus burnettii]
MRTRRMGGTRAHFSPPPKRQRTDAPDVPTARATPADVSQQLAGPFQLKPTGSRVVKDKPSSTPQVPTPDGLPRLTVRQTGAELQDPQCHLFWFLPDRYQALVSQPSDISSFTESPPEIPTYREPELRTIPVGMVLNVPDYVDGTGGIRLRVASDAAILHVSFAPPFYNIMTRTARILQGSDYCVEPKFATEKLRLIMVKELIQNHMLELTTYRHKFLLLLRSWRKERRLWEVRLALSQVRRGNESIFQRALTHEDLDHLCSWFRGQQAAEDRGEIEPCSFGRATGMVHISYKEMPHNADGSFADDAMVTRWESLKGVIRDIIARIDTLQAEEDEQRRCKQEERAKRADAADICIDKGKALLPHGDSLLVDFEFDDEDPFPSPPVIDPLPQNPARRLGYYHWQVERHGMWAAKGLFKRATYLPTFQLAPPDDISFYDKPRAYWPRGHQGLIPEYVDHVDDFQVHPWGTPATRFTHALHQQPRYNVETIYSKKARLVLKGIEGWYFANKQVAVGGVQDWPLPSNVKEGLTEIIKGLQ